MPAAAMTFLTCHNRSFGCTTTRGRAACPLPRRCLSWRPRTRSSCSGEPGGTGTARKTPLTALLGSPEHRRPVGNVDAIGGACHDLGDAAAGSMKHAEQGPHRAGRDGERDFKGEKRSNETPAATTDEETPLFCKSMGSSRPTPQPGPPEPGRRCRRSR